MNDELKILTDSEVHNNITSISKYIELQNGSFMLKDKKICIDDVDLSISIPGECFFPELYKNNEKATREEEEGILTFSFEKDNYLWLNNNWHHFENVLNVRSSKSGWVLTENLGERLLVLILTQIDYPAKRSRQDVIFSCCPLNDPSYLLWQNHRPVGMSNLKLKGTDIWNEDRTYVCDVIDTIYIRPAYRRQGHAVSLLYMLTSQLLPGEHLGLSFPISDNMCKVLLKFIQLYPSLRDTLWTFDEEAEVSGTVCLMLGTMIENKILEGPFPNTNISHNIDQK